MNEVFHIHEVLNMIHASDQPYTTSSLLNDICDRFGGDPRFTSCSDNTFDKDEVISFLLERRKISLDGDRIIPLSAPCNH